MERTFNYDNNYYDDGIGGFHKASIPFIHQNFDVSFKQDKLKSILDFGCGNGFHGAYLKSKCESLDGVDFSTAIEKNEAKNNYDKLFFFDLGGDIELPENHYDLLFSIEVIEHVKNYRKFLLNAYRLVKPGGKIFLTTTTYFWSIFILLIIYRRKTNFKTLYQFFMGWMGSEKYKTDFVINFWEFFTGHYHGFSKSQIKDGFEECGFAIETIRFLPIQPVFPVEYLKQPYTGKFKFFIQSGAKVLIVIGTLINFICEKSNIYSPNILIIAQKK